MSQAEIIIRFIALAVLGTYLVRKHQERHPVRREEPSQQTGHGLDTAFLQTRLQSVRGDFFAERRRASSQAGFRKSLVERARHRLSKARFFQAPDAAHLPLAHEDKPLPRPA